MGADGVEYLEWTGERSARIRLFNADGSIAEISGNGTRCVAAWMAQRNDARRAEMCSAIETDAGRRECRIVTAPGISFEIATGMGVPKISTARSHAGERTATHGAVVSMGNPHFVIFVDDENFSSAA